VEVEPVRGYVRNADDPDRARHIAAYFRLVTRHKKAEHALTCEFTPAGQLQILLAHSQAVEVSLRPFNLEDGKQVFRLSMMADAEKLIPKSLKNGEYLERVKVVRSSRALAQYFRSAVGVAKLWVLLGKGNGRTELSKLVSIKMNGLLVPWSKFFFEHEDAPKLAKLIGDKKIKYPQALVIHVREKASIDNGKTIIVRCTVVLSSKGPPKTFTGVSLFGDSTTMKDFEEKKHYVVVTKWRRAKDTLRDNTASAGKVTQFQNIYGNIFQANQFTAVDPPEP
jgi:hypothetical protein